VYSWQTVKPGQALAGVLSDIVVSALKKLPAPKLMRWGDSEHQFVRPVHGLVILHGNQVIDGEVLGLKSGNSTQGHRFLCQGAVNIPDADSYARVMFERGRVVASFAARRELIGQRQIRRCLMKSLPWSSGRWCWKPGLMPNSCKYRRNA